MSISENYTPYRATPLCVDPIITAPCDSDCNTCGCGNVTKEVKTQTSTIDSGIDIYTVDTDAFGLTVGQPVELTITEAAANQNGKEILIQDIGGMIKANNIVIKPLQNGNYTFRYNAGDGVKTNEDVSLLTQPYSNIKLLCLNGFVTIVSNYALVLEGTGSNLETQVLNNEVGSLDYNVSDPANPLVFDVNVSHSLAKVNNNSGSPVTFEIPASLVTAQQIRIIRVIDSAGTASAHNITIRWTRTVPSSQNQQIEINRGDQGFDFAVGFGKVTPLGGNNTITNV